MLDYLAMTLVCLGYIDQGRSRMDEALSEARRLRHAHTLAYVLTHQHWTYWLIGSSTAPIEELLILTTEHGFPHYLSWALALRGWSLTALGQAQDGVALVAQGLEGFRAIGSVICKPIMLTWLAKGHAMLGRTAEAQACFTEAARVVETTDERWSEAEILHRVPGDLLDAAGDQTGAERRYRQAIAVAERQSAKLFQLRASVSLARLWRDQGKRAEARDLLGPIYHWFTEGFDAPDLKDAKALLDELA
jgi:tetratricopeptide (TPR) repeat protein